MKDRSHSRFWGVCTAACLASALLLAAASISDSRFAPLAVCVGALGAGLLLVRARSGAPHPTSDRASRRGLATITAAMFGAVLWIVLREPLGPWTTALPLALFAALFAVLLRFLHGVNRKGD